MLFYERLLLSHYPSRIKYMVNKKCNSDFKILVFTDINF